MLYGQFAVKLPNSPHNGVWARIYDPLKNMDYGISLLEFKGN